MPNQRKYTDEQLIRAVATSTTWADVLEALGKRRGGSAKDVQGVAAGLGLDTSHFDYRRSRSQPIADDSLFSRAAQPDYRSSLVIAARWFLDRQYIASVPLEVAPYDLVVESDKGLQRVQVKSTGFNQARIGRLQYDGAAEANARGRVRRTTYTENEVDLFFIVAPTGLYLVPIRVVLGLGTISLEPKYSNFRVE
jgi:hypothetical protein